MKNTNSFHLASSYKPTGDQPQAIERLVKGITEGETDQTLVGVTGSGKTFTMAEVIEKTKRPTLIISHNKTLAAQLYQEFHEFFPENAVSYFVSYYDYYQPEAYIPQSDTYIEKETQINEEIDKLRLSATTNLLTRPDTIVIASVSCIYNIGSPREYGQFVLELQTGMETSMSAITTRLVQLMYERNDWDFKRSTFRVRGNAIDIYPAYEETPLRLTIDNNRLQSINTLNPITGSILNLQKAIVIYPAKHYMTNPDTYKEVFRKIEKDTEDQVKRFKTLGKLVEAQRIETRVHHDLDMIREIGYVNGIENYSRYFDGRKPGEAPYTLLDYFSEAVKIFNPKNPNAWNLFIDESHISIPQIRGMYNGDRSRKQTLIDYGFRLPSALDNRPLTFDEFLRRRGNTVYVSATPDDWELSRSTNVVEQLVRPTGLLDPKISVRPTEGQVEDLITEIDKRIAIHERVLVTTLTKRMAEDLTLFLKDKRMKVQYIHSDVKTIERTAILSDLRKGAYDVIVGVNLLREGLDLPEVSLVAILDADKEGFLRNKISLIQTMGRAARHVKGEVILYASHETKSISEAIAEVERRRTIQIDYNTKHHITPTSIQKPIRNPLVNEETERKRTMETTFSQSTIGENLTPKDKNELVKKLRREMQEASKNLDFEKAAEIRDVISLLLV